MYRHKITVVCIFNALYKQYAGGKFKSFHLSRSFNIHVSCMLKRGVSVNNIGS